VATLGSIRSQFALPSLLRRVVSIGRIGAVRSSRRRLWPASRGAPPLRPARRPRPRFCAACRLHRPLDDRRANSRRTSLL